ncbi:hypothetical protein F4775DRAFT_554916 [Biscogniauxia sp. FL1348]|nr:hypothetical protein F4775DRAFT_554916 [Biscogniauxia sp. FL1348]
MPMTPSMRSDKFFPPFSLLLALLFFSFLSSTASLSLSQRGIIVDLVVSPAFARGCDSNFNPFYNSSGNWGLAFFPWLPPGLFWFLWFSTEHAY